MGGEAKSDLALLSVGRLLQEARYAVLVRYSVSP